MGEFSIDPVVEFLTAFQDELVDALAAIDGQPFRVDDWTSERGRGSTRVLEGGRVFERAAVNFSQVRGARLPPTASARHPELAGHPYAAAGVSLVIHPLNPHVPTSHCNVRVFEARPAGAAGTGWFGGGFDLTPYYGYDADCIHWHRTARAACAPFGPDLYPRLKRACDDYFYLPHREEPRGIGGLFFDDWNSGDFTADFALLRAVAGHYLPAYLPIVERRKDQPWTERERDFQRQRRGRYVEFNLVHDRGTLFGLHGGGRTESILCSMPPEVSWHYCWSPEPGSNEARLYERYLVPRDWADLRDD